MKAPGATLPPIPRLPDEPAKWHERRVLFVLAGPSRSALQVFREEAQRSPGKPRNCLPGNWKEAMELYQWKATAEAWDTEMIERRRAVLQETIEKEREKRLSLLTRSRRSLGDQLTALTLVGVPATWETYWRGLKVVADLEQKEAGFLEQEKAIEELERVVSDLVRERDEWQKNGGQEPEESFQARLRTAQRILSGGIDNEETIANTPKED